MSAQRVPTCVRRNVENLRTKRPADHAGLFCAITVQYA